MQAISRHFGRPVFVGRVGVNDSRCTLPHICKESPSNLKGHVQLELVVPNFVDNSSAVAGRTFLPK